MSDSKRILFVDTETNGLPKNYKLAPDRSDNWPRIVQIAWIIMDRPYEITKEQNFIIQPDGWEIGDSEKIHNISPLVASTQGVPIKKALEAFISDLDSVQLIVAHNTAFDRPVIASELMRANLRPRKVGYGFYCTQQNSTDIVRIPNMYGYKWPSLAEAYRHFFRSDFSEAHNAIADVKACAAVYWKLQELGTQVEANGGKNARA